MHRYRVFPDFHFSGKGPIAGTFVRLGITSFLEACRYVHELPYGYNSCRDDVMVLFRENAGTCTTKHAVIAALAQEIELAVHKQVGIYAMTEELVSGAGLLLSHFSLPFIPMAHCFLSYEGYRVDLTEGNANGKNRAIEDFLYVRQVEPNISERDEYLLYRQAVSDVVLRRSDFVHVDLARILKAREEGLKLLRKNVTASLA
jgi:hypothetical protein